MAASLLHFDDEASVVDDSSFSEPRWRPQKDRFTATVEATQALLRARDGSGVPPLHGGSSSPAHVVALTCAEDAAKHVDETISVCFRNVHARTDTADPVSSISEDSLLEDDEVWIALTSNYGLVRPVDWKQSQTCCLRTPAVNVKEQPRRVAVAAEEPSDEEELREQLDMHSIIVSCLAEEPLLTAEQVIEEIEEIMQDSPGVEADHPPRSGLSAVSAEVRRATSSPSFEKRLRALSVANLNEHLEGTETDIRRFSEELVQQLALRDELDFEKEVKNTFISTLIDVQNRQKEQRELMKRKRRERNHRGGAGTPQGSAEKSPASRFSMEALSSAIQSSFRSTFGSSCSEPQYLTTVIPYEKKGRPPSLRDLQILTKILQAMRDDSDKVPGLLTDYILQVLCPT
ncbi:fasciculation and elongation protein zeta-2 [Takifugu flavidus]|uniref:fasciculation and elongation protein zeta-2 n=1 Tax=Takifugu flavidus TaxID=433684 RepID=UPI00254469F9|nr:fasciculation and elongation protein zeta-2 [Takifugu flavidus]